MKVKNKNCSKITLKLSKNCLHKIKETDLIKKTAIKTGNRVDWDLWRKAKNKVNNLVRNESKKSDENDIIKVEKGKNCSELWNFVKKGLVGQNPCHQV